MAAHPILPHKQLLQIKTQLHHHEIQKGLPPAASVQKMINTLQHIKATAESSDPQTKKLIDRLKSDFEQHMNNDLHVEKAFETLFATVSKLTHLAKKGKVNKQDAEEAIAHLKSIDQVLQVVF